MRSLEELDDKEKELTLLTLSFYLASWGMYRGSSFTLQYDHHIFEDVINEILKEKYDSFWDLDMKAIVSDEYIASKIYSLALNIDKLLLPYKQFTESKSFLKDTESENVSRTLITKILLGTICCTPAYDRYFCDAVDKEYNNVSKLQDLFNMLLIDRTYENLSKKYNLPLMKVVDIAYFTIGLELEFENQYNEWIKPNKKVEDKKCVSDCGLNKRVNSKNICVDDCTATPDKKLLASILKNINAFYYKLNEKCNKEIHTTFDCDSHLIERFVETNK